MQPKEVEAKEEGPKKKQSIFDRIFHRKQKKSLPLQVKIYQREERLREKKEVREI